MSKAKLGKKNPNRKHGEWEYLSKAKVKPGEVIHHKDGHSLKSEKAHKNNDEENLVVMTRAEHNKIHDRNGGRKPKRGKRKKS